MIFSDESDLTDLSSDEEYLPSRSSRKTGPKKSEYVITNVLRPPRTTQYTAKSLYDQIIDGTINLNPEYQRDIVWPETKQIGLIDSILRNYYIPPIIFAVTSQDDGTETRTCIDGKQRLTSLHRFMDGMIPHKDSFTNQKFWYKTTGDPKKKALPKQYLQKFANKQIVCVEYELITDDQEREIFQRVQLGMALTPAERMQAITGPWPSLIREIQNQVLGADGLGSMLDWSSERGRDFQCLVSIVYIISELPQIKAPGAPQLTKFLEQTKPVSPNFRSDLLDSFKIYLALAGHKTYGAPLHIPSRLSPIEFIMIGVMIYLQRTKHSFAQLSSAISHLRAEVRTKHADIRSNSKVTKTMYDWMTKEMKVSKLKSDGRGDVCATLTLKNSKSLKRKRAEESEESEADVAMPPSKSRVTSSKAPAKSTTPSKVSKSAAGSSSTKGSNVSVKAVLKKKQSSKVASSPKSPPAGPASAISSSPASKTNLSIVGTAMPPPRLEQAASTKGPASAPVRTTPINSPSLPPSVVSQGCQRVSPSPPSRQASVSSAVASVPQETSKSSADNPKEALSPPDPTPAQRALEQTPISVKSEPQPISLGTAGSGASIGTPTLGRSGATDRLAAVKLARAFTGNSSAPSSPNFQEGLGPAMPHPAKQSSGPGMQMNDSDLQSNPQSDRMNMVNSSPRAVVAAPVSNGIDYLSNTLLQGAANGALTDPSIVQSHWQSSSNGQFIGASAGVMDQDVFGQFVVRSTAPQILANARAAMNSPAFYQTSRASASALAAQGSAGPRQAFVAGSSCQPTSVHAESFPANRTDGVNGVNGSNSINGANGHIPSPSSVVSAPTHQSDPSQALSSSSQVRPMSQSPSPSKEPLSAPLLSASPTIKRYKFNDDYSEDEDRRRRASWGSERDRKYEYDRTYRERDRGWDREKNIRDREYVRDRERERDKDRWDRNYPRREGMWVGGGRGRGRGRGRPY